jgi:IclR family acetate operon transcriptional repressor
MQALTRLVSILELVAASSGPAAPAEIAQRVDLPLSTVTRLMRQLADEDLLFRTETGHYMLGSRIFALASVGLAGIDFVEVVRPTLTALRDRSGETVSLHVMRGTQRVCVAEVQSDRQVRRIIPPGTINGLCGTATGEVLLAGASAAEIDAAARSAGLDAAERAALDTRLAQIRRRGYAINDHFGDDLTGISTPLRSGTETLAAISISGPSGRFGHAVAARFAETLLQETEALSRRLARPGHPVLN